MRDKTSTGQGHGIKYPLLILALAILAISLSPIITRFTSLSPLVISTYRMLWATLFTWLLNRRLTQKVAMQRRDFFFFSLSGMALAMHFWSWITSITLLPVSTSTLLVSVHPLVVIPFGLIFFKEKLSLSKISGLFLVAVGTIGLTASQTSNRFDNTLGVAMALIGAITIAIYLLIGKAFSAKWPTGQYTFYVYSGSAITLALMSLLTYQFSWLPWHIDLKNHLLLVTMALVPTLLGHSLLNYLLKYYSASTISLATLGEPVIASALAWFIFNEALGVNTLLFGLMTLLGIWITEVKKSP